MSCVVLIVWMGFIFWFSSQDSSISSSQSAPIVKAVTEFVNRVAAGNEGLKGIDQISIEKVVRKSAHFMIYLVLGILTVEVFLAQNKQKNFFVRAVALCALYAVSDEFHQHFVPGRSMQMSDMILDTVGSATGALIWILAHEKIYVVFKVAKFQKKVL